MSGGHPMQRKPPETSSFVLHLQASRPDAPANLRHGEGTIINKVSTSPVESGVRMEAKEDIVVRASRAWTFDGTGATLTGADAIVRSTSKGDSVSTPPDHSGPVGRPVHDGDDAVGRASGDSGLVPVVLQFDLELGGVSTHPPPARVSQSPPTARKSSRPHMRGCTAGAPFPLCRRTSDSVCCRPENYVDMGSCRNEGRSVNVDDVVRLWRLPRRHSGVLGFSPYRNLGAGAGCGLTPTKSVGCWREEKRGRGRRSRSAGREEWDVSAGSEADGGGGDVVRGAGVVELGVECGGRRGGCEGEGCDEALWSEGVYEEELSMVGTLIVNRCGSGCMGPSM
ncbi:hypothetical protein BV22DRAFT_1051250 [Leucogyrophana mollusca]|uniref:Uncharacterized protein n=1 Tax=Leucogyrophana mollusca TaxID=85980 RepID=A0ACB8B172_9AGAM|nr:hypothetical protein BV22DRAFT_1051250 [Leucogyrophana mollusca]